MAVFTGKRYMTDGIRNDIPLECQIIMWNMIDEDRHMNNELDCLQVFELKPLYENGVSAQVITKKQEQPERQVKRQFSFDNPVSAKIFVIDDISHITMLLNHEY